MNKLENGDVVNGDREWDRLQVPAPDYDEFDETKEDEKSSRCHPLFITILEQWRIYATPKDRI